MNETVGLYPKYIFGSRDLVEKIILNKGKYNNTITQIYIIYIEREIYRDR